MFSTRKSKVLTAAACGVVLGAGGLASAYWTGGGAGSGTSSVAASPASLVIAQAAVTGLMPGGSKALSGTITNPNPNTGIKVGSVTPGAVTVSAGLPADYTVTGTAAVNAIVPKNGSIAWSGLTLNMADTAVNQDAAKGATVTVQYSATPFVEPPAGPQLGTVSYVNKVLVAQNVGLWPTSTGNITVLPGDQLVVANVDWGGNHGDKVATTAGADGAFNFTSVGGFYVLDPQPLTLLRGTTRYPYSPVMMIG